MVSRVVAVRHAKALSTGYADEILRPLSNEGRSIQIKLAEHLKSLGICPDLIFCSPILRAHQTALILSEVYENTLITIEESLGYDFDKDQLLKLIPCPKENKTVFLVGHAPTLAEFVNDLVGKNALPQGLSTSSAAIVDFRETIAFGSGSFCGVYEFSSIF